jgi:16S rRNA (cytidine1402-2'-O)-methyltransferase
VQVTKRRRGSKLVSNAPDPDDPPDAGPDERSDARPDPRPPAPGLHVVSTPIGAARDITLRALDILAKADLLLAEDTRSLRRLMDIHGLRLGGRPLWSYHDHNGAAVRPQVLARLAAGASVALVSEAGTPLVADPGYQLVRAAAEAGYPVRAAPGASALLAALAVAGLPTDRFAFLGFPPATGAARARFAAEALSLPMTVVIYESPKRIHRFLGDLVQNGGAERPAALCRELTKRFEEVRRGSLSALQAELAGRDVLGEVVLVIGGRPVPLADADALDAALLSALAVEGVRGAADAVALRLGLPRRMVYQRALALRPGPDTGDAE